MELAKKIFNQLFIILTLLFFLIPPAAIAKSVSSKCLHATDKVQLKNYIGNYVLPDIIKNLQKSRKLFSSIALVIPQKSNYNGVQIDINNDGEVLFGVGGSYHEAYSWNEIQPAQAINQQCLEIINNDLIFHLEENGKNISRKYIKISNENSFFNVLFKGCYQDSSGEKWCFKDNKITVNQKTYEAELLLDSMELPDGIDNFLRIKGESLLWAFMPIKNGWKVYITDLASENSMAIEFDKPWKILTKVN